MISPKARRILAAVGWIGAVTATILNGVIVGYGAIWLQFFGESADAEDYMVSAGGYAAASVVLVLAAVGILTHRASRWLAWVSWISALALGLLAVRSAAASGQAEQVSSPINTAWDGVGGVVWAPWTWVLVAFGIHGLYKLTGRRPTAEASS